MPPPNRPPGTTTPARFAVLAAVSVQSVTPANPTGAGRERLQLLGHHVRTVDLLHLDTTDGAPVPSADGDGDAGTRPESRRPDLPDAWSRSPSSFGVFS